MTKDRYSFHFTEKRAALSIVYIRIIPLDNKFKQKNGNIYKVYPEIESKIRNGLWGEV
ncbi:hypothetical protein [Heyndrickxia oleronia]|uniref:hypothetical protein n=1 Tax=Heyndrickxia oleronia TaxID=38875 RepID=UPI001B2DFC29|nr:hypothetical protein [Heyndrickxia oleronia]GIN39152.1 hypothetical protein J19TS1_21010 [Heyndrickxia oleronia]